MISISEYIVKFKETYNPYYMVKAIQLVLRQNRMKELIYGYYCFIAYKPSLLAEGSLEAPQSILSKQQIWMSYKRFSRAELIAVFGDEFEVSSLPDDFAGSRKEDILYEEGLLILGEYGDDKKRVVSITRNSCVVNEHYTSNSNVTHIHAIYKSKPSDDVYVTTGDADKALDLWELDGGEMRFKKRIIDDLTGYTAIALIGDTYYFGTDFSTRPNYIERLDGKKFFFPEKAYKLHVVAFYQYQDRYILSVNKQIVHLGNRVVVSVFDTAIEAFIFCDFFESPDINAANNSEFIADAKIRAAFGSR